MVFVVYAKQLALVDQMGSLTLFPGTFHLKLTTGVLNSDAITIEATVDVPQPIVIESI